MKGIQSTIYVYEYKTIQDNMREMARKKVRCVSFSCQFNIIPVCKQVRVVVNLTNVDNQDCSALKYNRNISPFKLLFKIRLTNNVRSTIM